MLAIASKRTDEQIREFYNDRKRLPVQCRNQHCQHVQRMTLQEQLNNDGCEKCGK